MENIPKIHPIEEQALRSLCETVNIWATSKGWNEDPLSGIDVPPEVRARIDRALKAEQHMLFVTEIAESMEGLRAKAVEPCPHCPSNLTEYKGFLPYNGQQGAHVWLCYMCGSSHDGAPPYEVPAMDDKCPELTAEEAELADVLIRIFHYCGKRGINLGNAVAVKHAYNISRPHKHGKHC